jgi:hypothetical protein
MENLSVDHRTYAVPRDGGESGDYEDAAAVSGDRWPVCAAVADGATESVFARTWAKRLVRGVVQNGTTTAEALRDVLPDWQAEWRAGATEQAADRPWYVGAKAAEGAFAALLGLSLYADGRWRAVSVGDCCLFHVRNGAVWQRWPFDTPEAFTNRPALVPSRSDQEMPAPKTASGTWAAQDRFLLATDAVAAWLMEDEPTTLSELDQDAFQERVAGARADDTLRNDDATLLVLELMASPEADDDASESA